MKLTISQFALIPTLPVNLKFLNRWVNGLLREQQALGRPRVKQLSRSRRTFVLILAGMLALTVVLKVERDGQHVSAESLSCGITQLTFTIGEGNGASSINGDGTRIAFASNRDLLQGSNADGNPEIFLINTAPSSLGQITDTTGDQFFANTEPSMSANGTRIAFVSTRDLTGGNVDNNFEIFLYDTATNNFTQVTNSTGLGSSVPSISADGTRIAFASFADLTGGNADGSSEIFFYDTTTNSLTQVTHGTVSSNSSPSINSDGTRIAFQSDGNLTAGNGDGNREIFLYFTLSDSFTQVTDTTGGDPAHQQPSISGDGTRIAFVSNRFSGGNPDGNDEIFLYDTTTGGITQVTFTTLFFLGNSNPSINGDGTRIAFVSFHDLVTGSNIDGNKEIFLYNTTTNSLSQVTDTIGGDPANFDPSLSVDGASISFTSSRFANLGNADGNREIFLASCVAPQPPPPPASADLLISQSADKTSVKQGDTLTYTVTIGNVGPDGATDVVVNDTLSSGVTFVSAHANKGSFTGPPVGQTGTLSWNLGNVANGDQETAQIQVTVIIRGRDTITNTATVNSGTADPNEMNNSSSLATTVQPGSTKKK